MEGCRTATYSRLAAWLLLFMAAMPADAQRLHLDPSKSLTQYSLETWTVRDGLPQNSVTGIIQTRDGYLWFGTQEGLARYDGREFTIFDRRSGALPDNGVTALMEDSRGRLWIGTEQGLVCYEHGHFRILTLRDGLSGNRISALGEDHDGRIWVGTTGRGISAITDSAIHRFGHTEGFLATSITSMYVDDEGVFWIGTLDAGLVRMRDGEFTSFGTDDGLPGDQISQLVPSRDGSLWIGTFDGGIGRMVDGRFERLTGSDAPGEATVQVLHEDEEGALWIGLLRGGLGRYVDGRFTTLTAREGLAYEDVLALYTDREGSLWIGTDGGGLNRLSDGKVTAFTSREGLANDYVYTVLEADDGTVWIGTDAGLSRMNRGAITNYTVDDGLPDNWVLTLAEDTDGAIWIGTARYGLARFDGRTFQTFSHDDGLPSDVVMTLFRDSRDRLLVGTGRGLAVRDSGGFRTVEGLEEVRVTSIAEISDGRYWVGTMGRGVALVDDGGVVRWLDRLSGLTAERVLDLHIDDAGALWIGTWGDGLIRHDRGTFSRISTSEGLFDENVFAIREDGLGRLWITCNKGLYSVNVRQLDAVADGRSAAVTPMVLGHHDGLPSSEFNGGYQPAGWRGKSGRLWFPSAGGLVAVDPAHIPTNTTPPPIIIQSLTVDGQAFDPQDVGRLPAGTHRIEFRYAGLSFAAPSAVRYRYILEGDDPDWVDAGSRHEAFYTNLKPGAYTFRVAAMNADGIWSTSPASVTFSIKPYFYQTSLFYLLCLLFTGLTGIGLIRLRLRKMTVRQRELERLVDERTVRLRREMERAEEARSEAEHQRRIIEGQAQRLKELDQIKTDFFHNISHEFRTPLTLTIGPLENVLTGAYGRVNAEIQEQFQIVLRNARRLLRLINQVLDLAKIESGGIELDRRPVDLRPILRETVESFSVLTESKRVSLNLDVPPVPAGVSGDPDRLEKIFFNLISNAVKFTPEGGSITIRAQRVDQHVEVLVRDTGVGIPPEQLPYIFDRFHQVAGARSEVQQGSGIGLAFARELIELHEGSITVDSTPGVGTSFTVRFDYCDVAQGEEAVSVPLAEAGETAAPSPVPADAPQILVVDDNPEILSFVASCLAAEYHVETAPDGARALERIRRGGIDLVISDVSMPRMDGFELCQAVRTDEDLRHLPFIMLTARAQQSDRLHGLQAGSDDYLPKPFDAVELRARVANLLRLRRHQQETNALNHELRLKNAQLAEAVELKSRLISVAAHDLKNPLNAVREFARILQEEIVTTDPQVREILQVMYDSTDQMLKRVSRLLHSAALESGRVRLEKETVDLRSVVTDVARRYVGSASRKGQTIAVNTPDDAIMAYVDRVRIGEAVENLVSNAVKYSPEGGRIVVTGSTGAERAHICVDDEGPGLTEEDQSMLFRQFQRLSARPTGGESSFGLGLSIVRQIVDLHAGRVYATSKEGRGARFVIELPLARSEPAQAETG